MYKMYVFWASSWPCQRWILPVLSSMQCCKVLIVHSIKTSALIKVGHSWMATRFNKTLHKTVPSAWQCSKLDFEAFKQNLTKALLVLRPHHLYTHTKQFKNLWMDLLWHVLKSKILVYWAERQRFGYSWFPPKIPHMCTKIHQSWAQFRSTYPQQKVGMLLHFLVTGPTCLLWLSPWKTDLWL